MSSIIWNHFTKIVARLNRAKCNYCNPVKEILISRSSTSGMIRHMQSIHPEIKIDSKSEDQDSTLDKYIGISPSELITKLVCLDNMSFNCLNKSESVKYLFKGLKFDFPASRNTIKKCVEDFHKTVKMKIIARIKDHIKCD